MDERERRHLVSVWCDAGGAELSWDLDEHMLVRLGERHAASLWDWDASGPRLNSMPGLPFYCAWDAWPALRAMYCMCQMQIHAYTKCYMRRRK